MNVLIDNENCGKIIGKLFDNIVPKTCKNFKELLNKYQGIPIHRIIPGFMMQGGDITNGNGTGGYSIYGNKFPDENFDIKHIKRGLFSMANSGPNSNGSQFFITFKHTSHLDEKHVVFGEMINGYDVLDQIEKYGTECGKPLRLIRFGKCGMI